MLNTKRIGLISIINDAIAEHRAKYNEQVEIVKISRDNYRDLVKELNVRGVGWGLYEWPRIDKSPQLQVFGAKIYRDETLNNQTFLTEGASNIKHDRASGRSTRIVDQAIQDFFNKGFCNVVDHYTNSFGGAMKSDRRLLGVVLNRLHQEHRLGPKDIVIVGNSIMRLK